MKESRGQGPQQHEPREPTDGTAADSPSDGGGTGRTSVISHENSGITGVGQSDRSVDLSVPPADDSAGDDSVKRDDGEDNAADVPGDKPPTLRKAAPADNGDGDGDADADKAEAGDDQQDDGPDASDPEADTSDAGDADDAGDGDTNAEPDPDDDADTAAEGGGDGDGDGDGDAWQTFAEGDDDADAAEEPASRPVRMLRAFGRFWRHEWVLACLAGLGLAAAMTWPALADPFYTVPRDIHDPLLVAYLIGWDGHALVTDPLGLWNTNSFHPVQNTLAFSESMLGYAPLGLIGSGPVAAVFRYNIVFVLVHALAFIGAYALVRQLGARWAGAAMAGAAFAYAPWRIEQAGHLHVLSTGGIVLSLAMLARGHGWSLTKGYRPQRTRPRWAVAGWLVAAWQLTIGFGVGLSFVYVLALCVVAGVVGWLVTGRPRVHRRLLLADVGGGLVFAAVGLLMATPYFQVVAEYPSAQRSVEELKMFSPPLRGFLIAPKDSWLWGQSHAAARDSLAWQPEMVLLPGIALLGLAAAGLLVSSWSRRQRLWLAVGVAVTVILGLGTTFFGGKYSYLLLYDHLPGWNGLRTPGRMVVWVTLLLAILAAGAVTAIWDRAREVALATRFTERDPAKPSLLVRLALIIPLLLVLVEGVNTTAHPQVPTMPAAFREATGPVLVLPSNAGADQLYMLWSTHDYPRMVNGSSGFTPPQLEETRVRVQSFPDATSVEYLQDLGVRTVIMLPVWLPGTPWAQALQRPIEGLPLTREQVGSTVVFTINPG